MRNSLRTRSRWVDLVGASTVTLGEFEYVNALQFLDEKFAYDKSNNFAVLFALTPLTTDDDIATVGSD